MRTAFSRRPRPKDGQLFRNGQPIDGAVAFGKNSRKEGTYSRLHGGRLAGFREGG